MIRHRRARDWGPRDWPRRRVPRDAVIGNLLIGRRDPPFATVALLLLAVALIATWWPAWRASAVDPTSRYEISKIAGVPRGLRVLLIALVAPIIAGPAFAQKAPGHAHGLLFLPHGEFGSPLELSGGLGIFFEVSDDGELLRGLIAEGGAGQSVRGSFGYQSFHTWASISAALSIASRSSTRWASADSDGLGGEVGLTIAFARLFASYWIADAGWRARHDQDVDGFGVVERSGAELTR
jgi:hypothetical protein